MAVSVPFNALGLDPRLLKAVQKRGFAEATPVQAEAVPRALEGKVKHMRASESHHSPRGSV
jgi:superfamily II DNA/RNA helicase